jgi:hypothetical protein
MSRMELPESDSLEAHALLLLAEDGELTQETLRASSPAICTHAITALATLGWPVGAIPTERGSFKWGLVNDAEKKRQFSARIRSRGFIEWQEEAVAVLEGNPVPVRAKKATSVAWRAEDFTGTAGSRLRLPTMGSPQFRIVFALMNLEKADPATSETSATQFIAGALDLQSDSWPIEISISPLAVTWKQVPRAVLDAWQVTFGDRGRREALAGTLGGWR